MEKSEIVKNVFLKAGWHEDRTKDVKYISWFSSAAYDFAIEILREYADLHLIPNEKVRNGISTADIYFYENPVLDIDNEFSKWALKLGPLVEFANAQYEHILLLAGVGKKVYFYTIPDGKLYLGGNFNESIEKLLLGIKFGDPID